MKIFKGRHYGTPFPFPKILFGKTEYDKEIKIIFDRTALYNIGKENQHDINKLFGISYGLHHTNSDRVGWRNLSDSTDPSIASSIELVSYSYVNGKRKPSIHLYQANIGELLNIKIQSKYNKELKSRIFSIYINDNCVHSVYLPCEGKLTWLWYTLGLYFGGNKRAPHTITIVKA